MPLALNFSSVIAAHRPLSPLEIGGAIIIIVGLACDALILNRFAPAFQFRVTSKPWGVRELGIAVAVLLGLFTFSTAAYWFIAWLCDKDVLDLTPVIIPAELVLRLAVLGGFAVYFRSTKVNLRQAIGLDTQPPVRAAGWGAIFGLGALPVIGLVIIANDLVYRLLHQHPSEQAIVEVFLKTRSSSLLTLLVIFAVVVAPVFEEFIFRGFAYPVLKQQLGTGRALLIVSAAFALNHLHGPSLLPLFVLALGLGLAYELTGSLVASMTMHALFNSIMIIQVFYQRAHPS
jgi:membrane protease YdiL (CAAX protease family)